MKRCPALEAGRFTLVIYKASQDRVPQQRLDSHRETPRLDSEASTASRVSARAHLVAWISTASIADFQLLFRRRVERRAFDLGLGDQVVFHLLP